MLKTFHVALPNAAGTLTGYKVLASSMSAAQAGAQKMAAGLGTGPESLTVNFLRTTHPDTLKRGGKWLVGRLSIAKALR